MRGCPAPLLALAAWLATTCAASAQGNGAVDFQRDIRPILANNCFKCHGPSANKGGFRLDERKSALEAKAFVPGKPQDSEMIRRTLAEGKKRMPPEAAGDRLKPAQVEHLKKWIAQGAEYSPHWAYVQPKQTALPKVKQTTWPRNPIDYFILARLEKEGLAPWPEADRATLIRRLSLDLLGLLPSPREVEDFVSDSRPDAYG